MTIEHDDAPVDAIETIEIAHEGLTFSDDDDKN